MMKTKISPEKEFHLMSREDLLKKFEIEFGEGLSSERAANLLKKHGQNIIKISYSRLYKTFLRDLFDVFSILLWLAMILSILAYTPTGNPPSVSYLITALVMFLILIAKSSLSTYQDYNSIKSLRLIQTDKESKCRVLRDGEVKLIRCCDLTLGDLVYLERNQRVPADLRLIEAKGLVLDKSILTGETEYVEATAQKYNIDNKTAYFEASNMAFTNCLVVLGVGLGLVVSLGSKSHLNHDSLNKLKPIKQKKGGVVHELAKYILIVIFICLLGVIVYVVVFFVYLQPRYNISTLSFVNSIINIIIGGIPYGIPISVTVALFLVSFKLKREKILVKNVFAIDSLSSVDVIITDKTGTITRNELVVSNVMQATKEIDPELCYFDQFVYIGVDLAIRELLAISHFNNKENEITSSIEKALFVFAEKNLNMPNFHKSYKLIKEIEFNSANKYHVKILDPIDNDMQKKIFGYSKSYPTKKVALLMATGAPEILLKKCSILVESDGTESELSKDKLVIIERKLNEWSSLGRRVIVLCKMYLTLDDLLVIDNFNAWFKNCTKLSYVGLVGFLDPPKLNIHESIVGIRNLGTRVIMATGDYSITAASIAKEVGILSKKKYDTLYKIRDPNHIKASSIVLNGNEIDSMTKQEWLVVCRNYEEIVLSRATPTHKLICLREFQTNGFCTMMVGDGVNDVLALKSSNVSVAMAAGSRVVSEIANIVLLDNDFTYIYQMILTGKQTFSNIKKIFLYFTIVSVFAQAFTTLFSALFGIPNLSSNYCSLIVSVFADPITAVTYIFDAPEPIKKRNVHDSKEHLVDWKLFINGCFINGPLTTLLIYVNGILYLTLYTQHTPGEFLSNYFDIIDLPTQNVVQTVSFYAIVCMQVFGNLWAIRSRNVSFFKSLPFAGSKRNIPMLLSALGVYLVTIVLINVPWANNLIGTTPIPWPFYLFPFVYSFIIIIFNEIRLLITRFKLFEKIAVW